MLNVESATMDAKKKNAAQPKSLFWTQWVRENVQVLGWVLPAVMVILVVAYELGPARWIYETMGYRYQILADVVIFATVGPALAFIILQLLRRWLEERDTSDLQAHLLARSRADAEGSRQLNDDALQVLFAAGVLIDTLKAGHPSLPAELMAQVEQTEKALQEAVGQLRGHLLKQQS